MTAARPLFMALLGCVLGANAQSIDTPDLSPGLWPASVNGQWRGQWDGARANTQGSVAAANTLSPGTVPASARAVDARLELRATAPTWQATATLQDQWRQGQGNTTHAWLNELVLNAEVADWQLSAGKKIVSWDVGYAFRPNDVVQQEARRSLVSTTLEGRGLIMAERFTSDSAWSVVWVNPEHGPREQAGRENALALRYYLRQGAVDWHAFARRGVQTGASMGLAAAWVATDALELHASARGIRHTQRLVSDAPLQAVLNSTPWHIRSDGSGGQMLLGGTWTHHSQLSLLAETWWDGNAWSAAEWRRWVQRNQALGAMVGSGVPASALAGNLAWQAQALANASSLHRHNVYLRLSWTHEGWQPTLDLLYHPADGGRLWTAGLTYKGDLLELQTGIRLAAGPSDAILRQLPSQQQLYLSVIRSF